MSSVASPKTPTAMPAPGPSRNRSRPSRPRGRLELLVPRNTSATSTMGSSTMSLRPLSRRSAWRAAAVRAGAAAPSAAPDGERGAEDRGGWDGEVEKPVRRGGEQRRRDVPGPRASSASSRCSRASRRFSVSTIGEEDQRERERRHDVQRGRVEPDVERADARGPERRAEAEEDRDLRYAAPGRRAAPRSDDHADERERVRELRGRHV